MFFKPQTTFNILRRFSLQSTNLLTQMQTLTFVKSMEERKEESDKKAF